MKKLLFYSMFFLLFFTLNINVNAKLITIDDVVKKMNDNNILNDNEYFYMFGKMLNGNDEYDIKDFNYLVLKNDKTLDFIVAITDKKSGKKEITFSLSYQDDIINYTNNYKIDSLESRIITVIFNQIIYSIGEARDYDEDVIVNWMNQIDLSHLTNKDGIKLDYEKRTFSLKQEETTYDYDIFIPKAFTIDINNVTNKLPDVDEVKIENIKVDYDTIIFNVNAKKHADEECVVYRKNEKNEYEKKAVVSCYNGKFEDTNLEELTDYYYQVAILDKIMCNEEVKITTTDIPDTGTMLSVIQIGILIVILGTLFLVYQKHFKVKFKK